MLARLSAEQHLHLHRITFYAIRESRLLFSYPDGKVWTLLPLKIGAWRQIREFPNAEFAFQHIVLRGLAILKPNFTAFRAIRKSLFDTKIIPARITVSGGEG